MTPWKKRRRRRVSDQAIAFLVFVLGLAIVLILDHYGVVLGW